MLLYCDSQMNLGLFLAKVAKTLGGAVQFKRLNLSRLEMMIWDILNCEHRRE